MDSVERKVIKEVLNADKSALSEIIEANPNRLNFVSQCGECPLGIAIYKMDIGMVELLLQSGASVNLCNINGDTSYHIAARIGAFTILQMLYNTRRCNLLTKNKFQQLAYDIAMEVPSNADVNLLHLFGEWNTHLHLDDELCELTKGRKLCSTYLLDRCNDDIKLQRQHDVDVLINLNADERKLRRIIQDEQFNCFQHYQIPLQIPRNPMVKMQLTEESSLHVNKNIETTLINNNFHKLSLLI